MTKDRSRTKIEIGDYLNKHYLLNLISKIDKESKKYITRRLEEEGVINFDVSHGNIVSALYGSDGRLTMKEIGVKVNRSKATVSQLVDRMVKNGYVIKLTNPEDKRATDVVLTDRGWELKTYFSLISKEVIEKSYKGIPDEDIEVFVDVLIKIYENYKE